MQPHETTFYTLCVDEDPNLLNPLVHDIEQVLGNNSEVKGFPDPQALLEWSESFNEEGSRIALVVADHELPGMSGVDLLRQIHAKPAFQAAGKVLLSSRPSVEELSCALNEGALNANLIRPWTMDSLRDTVCNMITEYLIKNAPEGLRQYENVVNVGQISRALETSQQSTAHLNRTLQKVQRSFLSNRTLSDNEIEVAAISEIDRLLDNPTRIRYEPGDILFRTGDELDHIYLCVHGKAQLLQQIGEREIIFHSRSTGPILGVLAFTQGRESFFTCRAATELETIPLSFREVDELLQKSADFSVCFVTLLLRSLVRRNRRATHLQLEIEQLNIDLRQEKTQLNRTLGDLKRAQLQLVENEKMAALGQLVSGVAHELNNPVAAISRTTEYLYEDITEIMRCIPEAREAMQFLQNGYKNKAVSTRLARERINKLKEHHISSDCARTLVTIGLYEPEEITKTFGTLSPPADILKNAERYYHVGVGIRNLETCSHRIGELVASLRSYAKSDQQIHDDVNLTIGLDETLLLFGNKLRNIHIEKIYRPIPTVRCYEGQMNQIWTNLISNALQAMNYEGKLTVETGTLEKGNPFVRISDSGKGIQPHQLDRIFDINYTTKQGKADFGLGLGLPIAKEIVDRHGGKISVSSEPGKTSFTVSLPMTAITHKENNHEKTNHHNY